MLISILPEGGCLTNIFVSIFSALSEVGGERFIPSLIYTHRFAEYFRVLATMHLSFVSANS